MYLTVKNQLKHLSVREYQTLRTLCRLSKNLYNEALYSVRQYYFSERQYLRYESNYHVCKDSPNYKALSTDIAQQTLKVVDRGFKSFFALMHKAKNGSYQFNMVQLPHYLSKEGWFSLIIPRIKIKNGAFALPMSRDFKKEHGELRFTIPPNIEGKEIKEVRIHPRNNAHFFEIEYIYNQPEVHVDVDAEKFFGVDLGLANLAACVTSEGASFIIVLSMENKSNHTIACTTRRTLDFRASRTGSTSCTHKLRHEYSGQTDNLLLSNSPYREYSSRV